ncbi:hypothetical protein [Apibacter adventoris]|uniref:Uncharacterized protein n=1 Tax=Apibacter adventoris TaxID=1679466 RepID=A0A2S8A7M2_9FLAO|nr:hypothetical protein [Apibacter adventoris]PQL90563.1 hypothetical protein C4S77_11835 [Apibacter adventoris]
MKIQFFILVYALSLSLFFCQEQENVNIEKVLNNQLENGASAENEVTDIPTGYIFTEEDVNVESTVIRKILDNNGYKANQDDFNDKITKIFGTKQINPFYINTLEGKCNINTKLNHDIFDFPSAQIYVIPNKQIIFPILLLPQLIDYQKDYPKTALVEDKINKSFVKDDYKVNLKLWRDVKDLSKQRRFNQQLLIARNKYLFNDDPSQFVWLTNNDKDFMESLVTTFGYTENKKLLNWVMENNYNKAEEFIKNYVFVKNCQGDLEIRKDILKYIADNTNENENTYYKALESFGYHTSDNKFFNKNEKTKIIAYIANILSPLFYKYTKLEGKALWNPGTMLYNLSISDKNLIPEIEKNNYYKLPNLKQAIDNLDEEAPPLPAN